MIVEDLWGSLDRWIADNLGRGQFFGITGNFWRFFRKLLKMAAVNWWFVLLTIIFIMIISRRWRNERIQRRHRFSLASLDFSAEAWIGPIPHWFSKYAQMTVNLFLQTLEEMAHQIYQTWRARFFCVIAHWFCEIQVKFSPQISPTVHHFVVIFKLFAIFCYKDNRISGFLPWIVPFLIASRLFPPFWKDAIQTDSVLWVWSIAEDRWYVSIWVLQLLAIADDRFESLAIAWIELGSAIPAIINDHQRFRLSRSFRIAGDISNLASGFHMIVHDRSKVAAILSDC